METDWSVAAGAEDPMIETGWSDAVSGLAWADLRIDGETQRSRIAALPEAARSPVMADALALLNAPRGLLMTTKCDRWRLSDEERAELANALVFASSDQSSGMTGAVLNLTGGKISD